MLTGQSYCHVFVFACPNCAEPLATACSRHEKNPDLVDGIRFSLACLCGWSGYLLGLMSMRRWVEPWVRAQQAAHGD
jgi:hypothetical protein